MDSRSEKTEYLRRGDARRLLIIGGILLMLAGILFGDIFAVFILHPNADRIIAGLVHVANAIIAGDADKVFAYFSEIGGLLENRGTKVDAHVHAITLGYLAVVLAVLQPYVRLDGPLKFRLAQVFIVSACIMPPSIFVIHYLGLAYSPLASIGWASIFADLSGFSIILVCLLEMWGLGRYIFASTHKPEADEALPFPASWEARTLLHSGMLMLLIGFIYGAVHAGVYSEKYEQLEISRLGGIIGHAVTGDQDSASDAVGDYGILQGQRGTKIAAHAHINEFGMLALLLAFVQQYVFLARRWRRRWVLTFITGSFVLPIAVAMEMQFGLAAGGVADVGGLLVFIALSGMFAGIVRHSGMCDAKSEAGA